ncbi:hypothetical protein SAMN02745166_04254 [Prosthecobacter debontii]|uniref:Uncharacterized protein n=1 Tax=Prosthecobacter debontii TaxID=48467 RepID=A0A1T4YUX9_9BACT|nr:hypothetical protein [Prosthecobacter debontii]SKB05398.1 hypothetical protein SAMN02745166_04254 [Prosthecobacter debontii]
MIVIDESLSGQRLHSFTLECLEERMSVREIIRARIWQEVQDYNSQGLLSKFVGLIQPVDDEKRLNGDVRLKPKRVDWERQYNTALRAFETNGFFILIGDRQAADLDEEFLIQPDTEVSFVKLVPLVGG